MYKIYINETPLILIEIGDLVINDIDTSTNLLVRYNGIPRSLLRPIDMLEKTGRWESVIIYYANLKELQEGFASLYKLIEAAGGLVFNEKEEILAMYRRGSWDLPKGKIDKGEEKEAAAIREVQEETGLNEIDLGPFICETYHTYKTKKGKRILKRTYWYRMTTKESVLIPQTEEDIELVEWLKPETFLTKAPLYNTIRVVVEEGMEK
jgi:8-oxo-dGTP pyrophosphatase MutT (NUDIX family)